MRITKEARCAKNAREYIGNRPKPLRDQKIVYLVGSGKITERRADMIQDIAIEQLDIHPQNVRKVYTDIDELAESIKARGVMQNLTVVPNPDKKDHYLVGI